MAAFVQRVGQNSNTGSTATLVVSVANACPAGNSVLLVFRSPSAGTLGATPVQDTKSNTWTQELSPGGGGYVYRSDLTTPLTTSDTITITFSTAQASGLYAMADLFSGLGAHDASNFVASGVHSGTGTLAITALHDDALIYAAHITFVGNTAQSVTGSTAFTATGASLEPATGNCILTAYDPSPVAGSITASFTYSPVGTTNWSVTLLAYPGVAGAGLLLASGLT